MKERIISVKGRDKLENYYSEVIDLVVNCLLLRYLSSRQPYSLHPNDSRSLDSG